MPDLEDKIAKHLVDFFGISPSEAGKFAREAALMSQEDRDFLLDNGHIAQSDRAPAF
jgi:hypothetical protein